jgi:hypothetical protein
VKRLISTASCVFGLLCSGVAFAQTPAAIATVAAKPKPATKTATPPPDAQPAGANVQPASASAANAWMGAQLGYKIGDNSKELGDNLLVSAAVNYDIPLAGRKFHLPVISNFADLIANASAETEGDKKDEKLKELMLATSGIRVGLHPYREIERLKKEDFSFLVHGEGSWKYNGFKEDGIDAVNYLSQFRVAAGFELSIGVVADSKPLTLSVTPVLTMFDSEDYEKIFKEAKSRLGTVELVAVVPVSKRTGVLFEYVAGDARSFRAGIIVAAEK